MDFNFTIDYFTSDYLCTPIHSSVTRLSTAQDFKTILVLVRQATSYFKRVLCYKFSVSQQLDRSNSKRAHISPIPHFLIFHPIN